MQDELATRRGRHDYLYMRSNAGGNNLGGEDSHTKGGSDGLKLKGKKVSDKTTHDINDKTLSH